MKSGFIALVGASNVGKSTFLNALLGEKVAITSKKPQTTRHTIRGIYNDKDCQIVFIDTPGLYRPKHELGAQMRRLALKTLNAVDIVMVMIDAKKTEDPFDHVLLERLEGLSTPVFLLVNKIDAVRDFVRLKEFVEGLKQRFPFEAVFLTSALKGWHLPEIVRDLKEYLEEGPAYYPTDMATDQPEHFVIAERIREKVLEETREEVPHSVTVIVERITPDEENPDLLHIGATIVVERESQKKIVIGKGGKMMKRIGTKARLDILDLLGTKVFLDLHCKVVKDWRNNPSRLKDFGYREE